MLLSKGINCDFLFPFFFKHKPSHMSLVAMWYAITSNNLSLLTNALMALGPWRFPLIALCFSTFQIHITIVYYKMTRKQLLQASHQTNEYLDTLRKVYWSTWLWRSKMSKQTPSQCMAKWDSHSGLLSI